MRRHVLTIVAIFLALAIGVVLGATSVATGLRDALVDSRDQTSAQLAEATAERDQARRDAERLGGMAGTVTPEVAGDRLTQQPVLLVRTPGAEDETVDELAAALRAAGALDAGRITVTDGALDPERDTELQTIVENLPLGDDRPGPEADLGTRLAAALAGAAVEERVLEDDDRATVMTTLADADLVEYEQGTLRPAPLVVLVAGPAGDEVSGTRIASLARGLSDAGAGVVTTSTRGATGDGDAVSALRGLGDTGVTTVDNGGHAAGRLAVVLGLAQGAGERGGAYGLGGDASAALPAVPER